MKKSKKFIALILILALIASLFSINVNAQSDLPDFVDNSDSPYFPEIRSQGNLGSCVYFAETYYQFTYTMNKAMGVITTPENTFSPSWTFNFGNGGKNGGGWEVDGFTLMKEMGNVPLSTVPYTEDDYLSWHPQEDIWREALNYRVKDYTIFSDIGTNEDNKVTSPDDTDLTNIKTLLANGEVLTFTSIINSLTVLRLKSHSDVPANDPYVNEYVVKDRIGGGEAHRMTIVGYNDNIWTDINDNNKVDSGEMGAFKVANSWGTDFHNKGFYWFAYDSINRASSVSGVDNTNRYSAVEDVALLTVRPYGENSHLYLRYTLNTCDRGQSKIYVTAEKDGETFTYEAGPKRKFGMDGSKFSYDGTTNSNDGTMIYALDNIVPDISSENIHQYKWSIKFEDTKADGKVFTVKNLEIVDEKTGRISKPENAFPFALDGSSKTIEYPTFPEYIGIYGDSNNDGYVTISDATLIQKHLVKIVDVSKIDLALADCNKDGYVNISDSTCIQKFLAKLNHSSAVGEKYSK